MPDYRYGYDEIAAAVSRNDEAVNPENDHKPAESAEDLLDPVASVLAHFGIDPEAVTEASMQRALRIGESGEIPAPLVLVGGFVLLASWGAAWLDGFAAALALVKPLDEDGD